MVDDFDIPVQYQHGELLMPARLFASGWTQKIEVDVYGSTVSFERDEEGAWRALVSAEDLQRQEKMDKALLEAIALSLERILG